MSTRRLVLLFIALVPVFNLLTVLALPSTVNALVRHRIISRAIDEARKPDPRPAAQARKAEILARLPENPPFYEKGHMSDRWERFFAEEIVREQVFELYHDEIPHATAVMVDAFREQQGHPDEVFVTLYVERDGQKGILIGKGGKDLHRLTERAQAGLENFLGRPVRLEVWIKVRKDWRKDERSLQEFGYLT